MPGTSAVLTPFCKTDGLYFNGNNDPEDFKYIYDKDIVDTFKKDTEITVTPTFGSVEDYFNYHLSAADVNKNFKIYESDNIDNCMVIDINLDSGDE